MTRLICFLFVAVPLFGADITELVSKLRTDDVKERRAACEALGNLAEEALPAKVALSGALKDDDVQVRAAAAWALGKTGAKDAETIQNLIAATGDKDWTVRHNAALSLVKADAMAVDALSKALKNGEAWQRFYAADCLIRIDKRKKDVALPAIMAALTSGDVEMQSRAAGTVAYLGRDAASAGPDILKLVSNTDPQLRISAIAAAGALGSVAKDGVPVLIGLLENEKDNWARCAIYSALGDIREPTQLIIPALIKGLGEKSERPQTAASEALAGIGSDAVDPLLKSIHARTAVLPALDVLVLMGPPAKKSIPSLLELMADSDWIVRLRTAAALGAIGETTDEILQALKKATDDPHESVRAQAGTALALLEKKPSR